MKKVYRSYGRVCIGKDSNGSYAITAVRECT